MSSVSKRNDYDRDVWKLFSALSAEGNWVLVWKILLLILLVSVFVWLEIAQFPFPTTLISLCFLLPTFYSEPLRHFYLAGF